MRSFTINKNDAGQRVDKFITKAVPLLPQSMMYKAIRNKRVKLNKKRCQISDRLAEGDILELYINDEFFSDSTSEGEYEFLKAPTALNIVYEDENIILADKKSGLVVHEDEEKAVDTLINRILHYLYDKGEYDPERENSFTPALCNRIDRNTSGIVIAAKTAEALRVMNQKIRDREIEKYYLCITVGKPPKSADTAKAYLRRDETKKQVFVTDRPSEGAKTAITKYRVVKTKGELSLVEVELITGRTHQIRAHMAHMGCPLLGDGKYGSNEVNRRYGVKTQALCSYRLKFAFTTPAEGLEYLNGKEFTVGDVWFKKLVE